MEKKKCNQCGFEWIARLKEPRACPNCKRYDWNKKKVEKKK